MIAEAWVMLIGTPIALAGIAWSLTRPVQYNATCDRCLDRYEDTLSGLLDHIPRCSPHEFLLEGCQAADTLLPDHEPKLVDLIRRPQLLPPDLGTQSAGPG